MKTLKIEREVTEEDVFVVVRTPNELSEVEQILAKTDLRHVGGGYSDPCYIKIYGGSWFKTAHFDSVGGRTEISIPQLAELLGVEYPLKSKFEAGKWYHYGSHLICYVGSDEGDIRAYGFDDDMRWIDKYTLGWESSEEWNPAHHKEVEAALIAEARKRGFEDGVEIDNSDIGVHDIWRKIDGDELSWDGKRLEFVNQGAAIFHDGKWAEVVEEERNPPTLEELIAEAKSKITVKTESYPCWVEGTREVVSYIVAGTEYMTEKLAIIGYIAERLREEYL